MRRLTGQVMVTSGASAAYQTSSDVSKVRKGLWPSNLI